RDWSSDVCSSDLLRGKTFTVFGREFHTISVFTGLVIIAVGILFWTTNGLVQMPELLPTSASAWLQESTAVLSHPIFDILLIVAVVGVVLWLWIRARYRKAHEAVDSQVT